MRFAALLFAAVWAQWFALRYPCPKSLRLYFAANLIYLLGTQPFLFLFGRTSVQYEVAYYGFAALHSIGALNVAREQLARRWHLAAGFIVGAAIAWRAYAGFAKPLQAYQWFALLEGGTLALAGTALCYSAARNTRAGIMLALAALWQALAWFRLGFAIDNNSELWHRLNLFLPTYFVCIAFGWIGLRLWEDGRTAAA